MTTHESELTEAVDLCTSDGRRLNPAAKGWSRHPFHRANLAGVWGRNKRWDYWAVMAADVFVSVVYADIDYLGLVGVGWGELTSGRRGGRTVVTPLGKGVDLPEVSGDRALRFRHPQLTVDLVPEAPGTRLSAGWTEPGGGRGELDVVVAEPPGHESLNVVIPWNEERFQFTSKHQARPVEGLAVMGGVEHRFGAGDGAEEAWGVLDVGRGRWPYRTRWNWAGGAGRTADGRVVGLQLGGKWTDGTGFTENGVLVDGRLVKVGTELVWEYDWGAPTKPWHVWSPAGDLDLTLTPRFDRHERTEAVVLRTEVHQVFGRWNGTVTGPDGERIEVADLVGFAEESRSRW